MDINDVSWKSVDKVLVMPYKSYLEIRAIDTKNKETIASYFLNIRNLIRFNIFLDEDKLPYINLSFDNGGAGFNIPKVGYKLIDILTDAMYKNTNPIDNGVDVTETTISSNVPVSTVKRAIVRSKSL